MADVLLVAASGLAREVRATLEAGGRHVVVGALDDEPSLLGTSVGGVPVLGPVSAVTDYPRPLLVVCAGRGASRRSLVARLSAAGVPEERYLAVVDPSVRIPASCSVGPGSVLLAQCVLTADVVVGRHVVAMPHVTLTHDDRVDDFATLCAGVTLGGSVHVAAGAYLGMNAAVREGLDVGADAVLGMGAVLLDDLPAGQTWAGCPARPLRHSDPPPHRLLDPVSSSIEGRSA